MVNQFIPFAPFSGKVTSHTFYNWWGPKINGGAPFYSAGTPPSMGQHIIFSYLSVYIVQSILWNFRFIIYVNLLYRIFLYRSTPYRFSSGIYFCIPFFFRYTLPFAVLKHFLTCFGSLRCYMYMGVSSILMIGSLNIRY